MMQVKTKYFVSLAVCVFSCAEEEQSAPCTIYRQVRYIKGLHDYINFKKKKTNKQNNRN